MIHSFHGSHTYRWIRWETCPVINVYEVPGGQVHKCESYTETKPAGIKIEIENFFSPFPPLSHEHPKWGFPGHRDGKRWNNSWPRKVHWMPPFNCSTLHITLVFFFLILDNFRGLMGFHQIWKLHQVVGRVGREKEEKKKKKYSSMCLLGTIDWLVNIFKWRFFSLSFLMSLIELHYEDWSYKGKCLTKRRKWLIPIIKSNKRSIPNTYRIIS